MARVFRHIVFFRFNDQVTVERVEEIRAGLTACARALPGTVRYECGPDVVRTLGAPRDEQRCDFALVGDFVDDAAWKVYDADAEHNRLRAELIGPVLAERVGVQYWAE
jgi:hypothetical protein